MRNRTYRLRPVDFHEVLRRRNLLARDGRNDSVFPILDGAYVYCEIIVFVSSAVINNNRKSTGELRIGSRIRRPKFIFVVCHRVALVLWTYCWNDYVLGSDVGERFKRDNNVLAGIQSFPRK